MRNTALDLKQWHNYLFILAIVLAMKNIRLRMTVL